VFTTLKIVYGGTEVFEKYIDKLVNRPAEAFLKVEQGYEDYVSATKPFVFLYYLLC
jgi:hypothetical protein